MNSECGGKQRSFFSSLWDRPVNLMLFFMAFAMVFWTVQCSLLQNILGLDILETITWGAQMTLGHSKHPPLSGWVGYFFSVLSGHSDWSLYFAAQLSLMIGAWFVYKLARMFWDEYASAVAALLLFFLFYYTPSETKFSTYFLEIALQPVMAYCFFKALREHRIHQWLLFGFFCGLGILNKYSTFLLLTGFLLIFFLNREYRKQFFSWGPWLALATFLLVISPHLVWLWNHDFACFKHIGNRMEEEHDWTLPLLVIAAAAYPFAMQGGVMLLACLPRFQRWTRKRRDTEIFRWSLILTLVPSVFFIVIALCGNDVIMMWFCSVASWTGIAVVAAFPFVVDREIFKRVYLLLLLFFFCMAAGTTCDLLFSSRKRIHTMPSAIVDPALAFWHSKRSDPVPVVVGERWWTAVIENYSEGRPPACEVNDDVFFELYRDRIFEKGALLAGDPEAFADFIRKTGYRELKFQSIDYEFKALLGRKKKSSFSVAYYPSRAEREQAEKKR